MSSSKAGTIAQLEREMKDAEITKARCQEYIKHFDEEYSKAYQKYWQCHLEIDKLKNDAN